MTQEKSNMIGEVIGLVCIIFIYVLYLMDRLFPKKDANIHYSYRPSLKKEETKHTNQKSNDND